MDNIKVNALMLRSTDYLENDKILTLLTAERGRITAGIKGVRKAGAKLKFASQPFCFAEYILAERGGRYTVTQASECESFYELRCDVNKFYASCAVCETAIALTAEGENTEGIFTDCICALRDMCSQDESICLINFLLSALERGGYKLALNKFCPVCGESLIGRGKLKFNMEEGEFTCWDCSNGVGVSGITYEVLCADKKSCGDNLDSEGKKRALKLLNEYILSKTDIKLLSLAEYLNLI
ncbi:MAG: DNA repair protein RecO [Candidatus Coproplasma sp.]